jgi:hypothetical protein
MVVFSPLFGIEGLRAGIYTEIWTGEQIKSFRTANAQLRYYLHIPDPDSLSDREWAMRIKELEWLRQQEAKRNK